MADNVTLDNMSGGDVCAADEIDGVKYQRMKLAIGADGVNDGDVSTANPMPVREVALKEKLYFDGGDIYACQAYPGSLLSSAVWQIKKYSIIETEITSGYANGAATFINRATNLETVKGLSYS
jgi:hypothetical protein